MKRLRGVRVSLAQLLAVCIASAVATAVVIVEANRESGPERAVIAALRTPQVVHARAPAAAAKTSSPAASDPSAGGSDASSGASASSGGGGGSSSDAGSGSSSNDGSSSGGSGGGGSSDQTSTTTSSTTTTSTTSSSTPTPTSPVKHVFVISLETPSYAAAFGTDSKATYLRKLRRKGALLSGYRTLDAGSTLPDLDALVSGQAPNRDTKQGCPTYAEFPGGAAPAKNGLVPGAGCIYPTTALTLGDDLDGSDLKWRGYIGGMTTACEHPNSGSADPLPSSGYATSRNPFVYFHSLLDLGDCQSNDLPLSRLAGALASAKRTPSFSLISPDMCASGETETCAGGAPAGLLAADAFLKATVPEILRSAAYRKSGALLILFGATQVPGPGAGSATTTSSTTTTPAQATTTTTTTPGGTGSTSTTAPSSLPQTPARTGAMRTGALLMSPFTRADSTNGHRYDAYSVLRWLTRIFAVDGLGQAQREVALSSDLIHSS